MRRTLATLGLVLASAGTAAGPAHALPAAGEARSGDVYAQVGPTEIVLGNSVAERRWTTEGLRTSLLQDKRRGGRSWGGGPDFALSLGGAPVSSEAFTVESAGIAVLPRGGLRVTMELGGPAGLPGALTAVRVAEAYPGIAGFRTQTILHAAAPGRDRGRHAGAGVGGPGSAHAPRVPRRCGLAPAGLHRPGVQRRRPARGHLAAEPERRPGRGAPGLRPVALAGRRRPRRCSWSWSATTSPPRVGAYGGRRGGPAASTTPAT